MVILLLYRVATNAIPGVRDPSQAVLNVSNIDLLSAGLATAIETDRSARLWDAMETSRCELPLWFICFSD